jgi:hypothetical protein
MNNQSNIFYYFTDKTVTQSKLLSIEYSKIVNEQPLLYYHDDLFNKVEWSVEPPKPLQEYYQLQAEKIRDEYDYVVLCYSGGIDSTNILETFYFNNIKIDKII